MRVLVFGAGGFIGSHLCRRLLESGYSVTAVDLRRDYKVSSFDGHPALTYIVQDIRDRA
jgi:nucleoside-diphosphate-sugar epimerase